MYLLLLFSITAAALNNAFLHKFSHSDNVYRFNLHICTIWFCILFLLNHGHIQINKGILFWGILYGVVQILFFIFKTLAMSTGPVAVTTLIGNCSMLLSITASILIWKEHIHFGHVIGILILLFSIFLCTDLTPGMITSKYWRIYCILFFILCGSIGIIFKLFSTSVFHDNRLDMMIISTITMILLLCIIFFCSKQAQRVSSSRQNISFSYIVLTFACGTLSCSYNLCNLYLSAVLPGNTFFPCFNGGVIILAALFSRFILHEHFTRRRFIGLILGTIAVFILSIL